MKSALIRSLVRNIKRESRVCSKLLMLKDVYYMLADDIVMSFRWLYLNELCLHNMSGEKRYNNSYGKIIHLIRVWETCHLVG